MKTTILLRRTASPYGETLVVKVVNGAKPLTDPLEDSTVVELTSGRRARLVRFNFAGLSAPLGRDTLTSVFLSDAGLGFASVGFPNFSVLLRDLSEGQVVDVLPAADAAAAYAPLVPRMPMLCAETAALICVAHAA
jgi:hypothetical protein